MIHDDRRRIYKDINEAKENLNRDLSDYIFSLSKQKPGIYTIINQVM